MNNFIPTPTQLQIYKYIRDNGYHAHMWKQLGFNHAAWLSQNLAILVAGGYLKLQPKYKAVKGKLV